MENNELNTRIEALGLLPTDALKAEVLSIAMKRVTNATIRAAYNKQMAAVREAEKVQKAADKAAKLAAKTAVAA